MQLQYTKSTVTMCCLVCKLKLYWRFCYLQAHNRFKQNLVDLLVRQMSKDFPYDNILNFMGYLSIGLIKEN